MVKLTINNKDVTAKDGTSILDAAKSSGFPIPTLCYMENLTPYGACRLCVVEIEDRPGLVPSCAFPVSEGMKILTHSPKALRARKAIVELLLANHPDDCLYCYRNHACQLQDLAEELGIRQRRYYGDKNASHKDLSSPSLVRDPAKCILCGKCVRVCEEIQGVAAIDFINRGCKAKVGTAFNEGMNVSTCINCGQCVTACPTGALTEQIYIDKVLQALSDPDKYVIVQHAPAVSVTLGEEFGIKPGRDVCGIMTTALRRIGFRRVFDTSFTADLTIMEEGSELVHRVKNNGVLPMLTSCSPGWIKFVEHFYPEFIPNLSTCKSPQQMMGALVKSYFASQQGIDPAKIFSVSIMPCTAKKFEAARPEMGRNGLSDVDAVLTTRELAKLIRMMGIDLSAFSPEPQDTLFGERSTAGKIFGASGGVMEAALRSAYFLITGKELEKLEFTPLRGFQGIKELKIPVNGLMVGVAVASSLANARILLDQVKNGRKDLHFIEVMTCPGGCINGGGQLFDKTGNRAQSRMQGLYELDSIEPLRKSHENKSVQRLYEEFLKEPLGHHSHELLHTQYIKRDGRM